jgi:hypothetical protein
MRSLTTISGSGCCGLIACLAMTPEPGRGTTAAPVLFHVARDGNDESPGTQQKPFATLERAQDAIRSLRRQAEGRLSAPGTVLVHGGTYCLRRPLVLTPDDSGSPGNPVTYAAFENERPVFSGGRPVEGWREVTVAGNQLWAAVLPDVRAGKWAFHQLWVNGQRRPRARHPREGFLRVAGLPGVKPEAPWNKGQDQFQFAPGDLKAWANLEDVEVVALHLWVSVRLPLAGIDERERLARFTAPSRRRLTDGNAPARYYVENALELLDAPGEWYLQRPTGTLYYWPLPGEKINTVEVIAPLLSQLVRLEGQPEAGRYVEHVNLRGLNFLHSEWWLPRHDAGDVQAAAPVPAVIQGDGVRHCLWQDCTVAHASGYGMHLARGCQHNRVVGCELSDLGAGGIKVGEMVVRDDAAQQTHSNALTDNHIHNVGQVFHQGVGIWIGQSHGNRVAHNHIHDLYYTGISCGWTWGYGKTSARNNVVEFNRVHDLGKEWLSDMGGIYTLGVQPGTVVRGNVFHDIAGARYGGWGIYLDEGSTQIVAENNLVYRTSHGGFHQHYGKDNVIRNNIFALGREAQLQRTRVESHRSFTFERNIVYWERGKLFEGKWEDEGVTLDHNLYWHTGSGEIRFGGRTWDEWRKKGQDLHSLRADPRFVNPGQGDFHLRPDSPAARIGFQELPLAGVGPRSPSRRQASP